MLAQRGPDARKARECNRRIRNMRQQSRFVEYGHDAVAFSSSMKKAAARRAARWREREIRFVLLEQG
jgi:hypothetical protein